MKTYCKPADVNIESVEFISPAVHLCFAGKLGKRKFQRLLVATGKITMEQLRKDIADSDMNRINAAIDAVAEMMADRIINRNLDLPPVHQFIRKDGCNGKLRELSSESAEMQICEYIAVQTLMPMFNAKILPVQCGSIPHRGQLGAARHIHRVMQRKHGQELVGVQCDVRKAYPSTSIETVMRLLERDIGKNKPLLWFIRAILESYPNGHLLIGGYLPCWLFNYVMSYVLRHLLEQAKFRRGKRIKMVDSIVNYADDFVAFGQKSYLVRAVKETCRWTEKELGLHIKEMWKVIHLPSMAGEKQNKADRRNGSLKKTPGVDMVGFVMHRTYTTIRGRNFVKIRRQLLRGARNLKELGYIPWWRAYKIIAGWGWLKYSNSRKVCETYDVYKIIRAAKDSVSWHARKDYYVSLCA